MFLSRGLLFLRRFQSFDVLRVQLEPLPNIVSGSGRQPQPIRRKRRTRIGAVIISMMRIKFEGIDLESSGGRPHPLQSSQLIRSFDQCEESAFLRDSLLSTQDEQMGEFHWNCRNPLGVPLHLSIRQRLQGCDASKTHH